MPNISVKLTNGKTVEIDEEGNIVTQSGTFQPESLFPAAGAIIGAMAGGIPGAAAGGFLGEEARIAANVARGQPSPNPLEILAQAGEVGAETGAAEAAGAGLMKFALAPIGRAIAGRLPFRGATSPESLATIRTAEREEITLPVGARTESPSLLSTEAGLVRVPGGGRLAAQRAEAEIGAEKFARRFAEKFGEPLSKAEAGIGIKQSFEEAIKNKNELSKQLYDKLEDVAGHVKVAEESDTKEFIENFLKARGITAAGPPGLPKKIQMQIAEQTGLTGGKLESKLASVNPKEYDFLRRVLIDTENPDLTFSDLKRIRTLVWDKASPAGIKATGFEAVYKKVYGTLTEDMNRTAAEGGFGEVANEAKSFYKQFLDFVESKPAKLIQSQNPEQLIDSLVGTNNETSIRAVMKEFDETGKNALRRGFLDKLFENATDETRTGFNVSSSRLATQMNKYSDGVVNELFGSDAKVFNEVRGIANAMRRGEQLRIGSPTAFLAEVFALVKGSAWRTISRLGVSRALEKESVKKLLTEGTPVEVPGVGRAVRMGFQALRTPLDIARQEQEQEQEEVK